MFTVHADHTFSLNDQIIAFILIKLAFFASRGVYTLQLLKKKQYSDFIVFGFQTKVMQHNVFCPQDKTEGIFKLRAI